MQNGKNCRLVGKMAMRGRAFFRLETAGALEFTVIDGGIAGEFVSVASYTRYRGDCQKSVPRSWRRRIKLIGFATLLSPVSTFTFFAQE